MRQVTLTQEHVDRGMLSRIPYAMEKLLGLEQCSWNMQLHCGSGRLTLWRLYVFVHISQLCAVTKHASQLSLARSQLLNELLHRILNILYFCLYVVWLVLLHILGNFFSLGFSHRLQKAGGYVIQGGTEHTHGFGNAYNGHPACAMTLHDAFEHVSVLRVQLMHAQLVYKHKTASLACETIAEVSCTTAQKAPRALSYFSLLYWANLCHQARVCAHSLLNAGCAPTAVTLSAHSCFCVLCPLAL